MPKTHTFTEAQHKEVRAALKGTKSAALSRKLQVLDLRMSGYKNEEIAKITKYSKSRVSALCCIYAKEGMGYFEQENRKSGNRRNLSYAEEEKLLDKFTARMEKGEIVTTKEIKIAYEKVVDHRIGKGQIYRVLARHEFRKVMPRSKHPNKASEEEIDSSKKLKQS